jgi:hypothetical protein
MFEYGGAECGIKRHIGRGNGVSRAMQINIVLAVERALVINTDVFGDVRPEKFGVGFGAAADVYESAIKIISSGDL